MQIQRSTKHSTNKPVRKSLPNKRKQELCDNVVISPKFPEDFKLINELRDIAAKHPTKNCVAEAKQNTILKLTPIFSELYEDDSSLVTETRKLEKDYKNVGLDLGKELRKKFSKVDDKEKKLILNMLLVLGNGMSPFIVSVLKKGKKDNSYLYCLEFLKSLYEPDIETFIYKLDCFNESNVDKLARSILEVSDEGFVLETLQASVSACVEEEVALVDIERKLKILNAIIRNYKGQLEFPEVAFSFRFAASWDNLAEASQLLENMFPKDEAISFYETYALGQDMDQNGRAVSIVNYSRLCGKDSTNLMKRFIYSDEPIFVEAACVGLVNFCGEEGLKILEEAIERDVKNDAPSLLLATLIVNSKNMPSYNNVLKKLFSKDIDLVTAFKNIADSKLMVARRDPKWSYFREIRPTFPKMFYSIGLEGDRLLNWMIRNSSETLRRNAKNFILESLKNDRKSRIQGMIGKFLKTNNKEARLFRAWMGM